MDLDIFDRKILAELQVDASRSTTEIAEAVGLSQAPCWRRIQRLKESGYIRAHVALVDRRKIGLNTQVFAQVKLSATGRANVEAFRDVIRVFPEVLDCFVLMGSVDFMLRIVTKASLLIAQPPQRLLEPGSASRRKADATGNLSLIRSAGSAWLRNCRKRDRPGDDRRDNEHARMTERAADTASCADVDSRGSFGRRSEAS